MSSASPALLRLVNEYLKVISQIEELTKTQELKDLVKLSKEMKDTIKEQMDRETQDVVSTEVGFVKMSLSMGSFKLDKDLLKTALGVEDLESYGKRGKDVKRLTSGFNDVEVG